MRLLILGFICVSLAGCLASKGVTGRQEAVGGTITQVFYGTDRNRREGSAPTKFYGEKRGVFEYGVATVTGVSDEYKTRLESVVPLSREPFLDQLRTAVQAAPEPTILVFVHGYLRSFRQVSNLAAEFVSDTGFRGVPVIWSWPSTTNPAGYTVDETSVKWAQPHFARFLQDVLQDSGAQTVHLVGHSLGARSLGNVIIQNLLPAGVSLSGVGEVILLAPDVDQEIFTRDIAPALVGAGLRVSLYTSANDKAMATAATVHGSRRAGDSSGGGPVTVAGVETIDVTAANRSILGHSYFEESDMVGRDLARLLNERENAPARKNLVRVEEGDKVYWRLEVERQGAAEEEVP